MKKTIGILGGMGPEATGFFFEAVVRQTLAAGDQGHARVLIWSDPSIPPRTEAILENGRSPLPALLAGVRILERGGAGLIVMPCITAHFWAPQIKAKTRVVFVDLIEETVRRAGQEIPGLKRAGLIATNGTVRSGIFHRAFARRGVDLLVPDERDQSRVMEAIDAADGIKAGVKTGRARTSVVRIAGRLAARGAQAIIAGCTEIPLVLRAADLSVPLLDPMTIGAAACLKKAGYPIK
ncbi:MAG: amino acid racemase [Candidatus Aminicenantales bacterium]|jgi:aspartate racemase